MRVEELADAAQLASLADETLEGRSIVVLAKEKYGLRGRDGTVFVRWPYGHPFGQPGPAPQQRTVLRAAFTALVGIAEPGVVGGLPFRWRRDSYPP